MPYEVLARKWRPQQFDDVVGQDHVTRTLKNAIKTNRIAHAYIFVGPRGIGKTSIARIFAKCLNCEKGPGIEPCGKCQSCKEITAGNSLDVMEIDGASNNGVEQVRDLRDTVKYMPARGAYKIYIIDEVHMLSQAAFNALLKTLEEPPPHVKFMFATTEPDKILTTILSRCQRFDLRRISSALIVERLKLIAEQEKIEIDEAALIAIARGAEGGLRDAESSLDQIVSFKGTKIGEEDVLSVFGLIPLETLERMGELILTNGVGPLIELVAELDRDGKSLHRMVFELIRHFRNLLVWMNAGDTRVSETDLLEGQAETLRRQAESADSERVLRILDILVDTEQRLRYALSGRTLLEVALIRCARAASVVSIEDILAKFGSGRQSVRRASPAGNDVERPAKSISPAGGAASAPQSKDDTATLEREWDGIIDRIAQVDPLARGVLLDCRPVSVSGATVTLGYDPEFEASVERVRSEQGRAAIEHLISRALGRRIEIGFAPLDENEAGKVRDGKRSAGRETEAGRNWIEEPTVKKTLDLFEGEISNVRE